MSFLTPMIVLAIQSVFGEMIKSELPTLEVQGQNVASDEE